MAKKKPKRGRPELPEEQRKIQRSVQLPQDCWHHIDSLDGTRGGRNREIERMVRRDMKRKKG